LGLNPGGSALLNNTPFISVTVTEPTGPTGTDGGGGGETITIYITTENITFYVTGENRVPYLDIFAYVDTKTQESIEIWNNGSVERTLNLKCIEGSTLYTENICDWVSFEKSEYKIKPSLTIPVSTYFEINTPSYAKVGDKFSFLIEASDKDDLTKKNTFKVSATIYPKQFFNFMDIIKRMFGMGVNLSFKEYKSTWRDVPFPTIIIFLLLFLLTILISTKIKEKRQRNIFLIIMGGLFLLVTVILTFVICSFPFFVCYM